MKRMLCIGDSNTWGYDPRSWFGSQYPADVRWTGLLETAGWQVFNCGQNGLSIPRKAGCAVYENLVRSRLPLDVVTVMLGSNDLLEGASAEEAAAEMKPFLSGIVRAAPEANILLIAPPVMQEGTWVQGVRLLRESERLAGRYRELACTMGIHFAAAGSWKVELCFDGVHFSPEGHAAFARGLTEVLRPMQYGEPEEADRIRRIAAMEARLDRVSLWLREKEQNPACTSGNAQIQEDLRALSDYYDSSLWREDFEADEAGLLPADLKRGVLSEDGIYNVLEAFRQE